MPPRAPEPLITMPVKPAMSATTSRISISVTPRARSFARARRRAGPAKAEERARGAGCPRKADADSSVLRLGLCRNSDVVCGAWLAVGAVGLNDDLLVG